MLKDFWAIENNVRTRWVQAETKAELLRFYGHGNVFDTRGEAERELEERKKPKTRHLTDEERRALEIEQQKFGWSMFTETEKAEIKSHYKYVHGKRVRKTIDDEQLAFAREMMRCEMAV